MRYKRDEGKKKSFVAQAVTKSKTRPLRTSASPAVEILFRCPLTQNVCEKAYIGFFSAGGAGLRRGERL